MKVLLVNETDTKGGAARAAYRLHKSLLAAGIQSNMLVQRKFSDDPTILEPDTPFRRALGQLRPRLDSLPVRKYRREIKSLFSPSWLPFSGMAEQINNLNPDIVHLHWIAGGMMRVEELAKIKAPIIWSLHDMWPFTGGCHYDGQCGRYRASCGNCPLMLSRNENDLSREVFSRKSRIYSKKWDMSVVGLSLWIKQCAESSSLLSEKRIVHLPNPIDTDVFRPFDKRKARELWKLPLDKKILLFGAMSASCDLRKGLKKLNIALNIVEKRDLEVCVFGASQPPEKLLQRFKTTYLGSLHDEVSLISLYNACDLMVVPSLQENLSNTIMESLACGTPVVAFNVGGNADMIEHNKNGYLAKTFEPKDLALGVDWVLDAQNYEDLRMRARDKVLQEFRSDLVAERYIKFYNEILQGRRKNTVLDDWA